MMPTSITAKSVFLDALELANAAERQAHIDACCGHDPKLRHEVEKLLRNHQSLNNFLNTPPTAVLQAAALAAPAARTFDPVPAESPGTMIGPYKLLEQIGEGGMGLVYMAAQQQPLRRLVALKIIKPGMDSKQIIARFEAERQALAMMDHPNIARVLDAGTTETGRPYFVMELVRGIPITEFSDKKRLGIRDRLLLFVQACQAVQHAHQKGIIHRDLKPTNVLVTQADATPVPKVIDFGVAKALGAALTDHTLHTGFAQLVGTPLYMSPEQAEFNQFGVDTRSDVYSLGVLLYELLTGTTPFDKASLTQGGFEELRRQLREVDPPRPSARLSTLEAQTLSTISSRRNLDPRHISTALRGELDWIVMKALEKNRGRRYESASNLATDIQCYLDNRPITARPTSATYRIRKWLCRHPTIAGITALAFLASLALVLGSSYYNRRLVTALQLAQQLQAETLLREEQLRLQLYTADIRMAWKAWQAGDTEDALRHLKRSEPRAGLADQRGFEWHYLSANCQPPLRTLQAGSAPVLSADISADDRYLACGDRSGAVKIWDFSNGELLHTWQSSGEEVTCVRFAPNGQTLATCGVDRTVHLWDTVDWSEAGNLTGHTATVSALVWSPNGKQLASGGRDHQIKIWDIPELRENRTLPEQSDVVRSVAWSPDGEWLATAVREDGLHVWRTKNWTLEKSHTGPDWNSILTLAFSSDNRFLASAGYGGHLRLLIAPFASSVTVAEFDSQIGSIWSVGFSPDNRLLVAGCSDGHLHLLHTRTTEGPLGDLATVSVGNGAIRAAMFSKDGQKLVTVSEADRMLRVHSENALYGYRSYSYLPACHDIAANTTDALVREQNGTLYLAKFPPDPSSPAVFIPGPQTTRGSQFLSRGDQLVTAAQASAPQIFDLRRSGARLTLEAAGEFIEFLVISPNDRLLAGAGPSGTAWLWNTETGKLTHKLRGHQRGMVNLAFSPDGKLLATGSANEERVLLWRCASGSLLAELAAEDEVWAVAFSPDGHLLAVATNSDGVQLWNVATCRQQAALRGHVGHLRAVAFAPDGRTLVTAGDDGTARLWHVATGQELLILARLSVPLQWIKFLSPELLVIGTAPDRTADRDANEVLVFSALKDSSK